VPGRGDPGIGVLKLANYSGELQMHDQIANARTTTTGADVAVRLNSMIVQRLFENDHWLVLGDEGVELLQQLTQLGLQARGAYGFAPTELSEELGGHELILVFLGMMNEMEAIEILVRHGLLSERHVQTILRAPNIEQRWEAVFRPIVQRAFLQHNNPMGSVN
jgi:hypothetical protein